DLRHTTRRSARQAPRRPQRPPSAPAMRASCLLAAWLAVGLALTGCGERERTLELLNSRQAPERAGALKRLAQRPAPGALPLFSQAARDPSALVRAEAATALGRSGDPRVVDLLTELANDADDEVQVRAVGALAQFSTERASAALRLQFQRGGRRARW